MNVLAPYMLTQLIERPDRLIYLSSSMHYGGEASLRDIDWTERRWDTNQAYSDSKLFITALAIALAKRWPKVLSNAVDPGWVPTKMGGAGAPDDLEKGTSPRPGSRSATNPPRKSVADTGITASNEPPRQKCLIPTSKTNWWPSSPN